MQRSAKTIAMSNEEYKILKHKVSVIAWMGEVISMTVLLICAFILHFRGDVVQFWLNLRNHMFTTDEELYNLTSVVVLVGCIIYAMSLVHILVCFLLLIGIKRHNCTLMFPWLLYHGLLFGVLLHLGIYVCISGIITKIKCFMLVFLVLTAVMVTFVKIYVSVLTLFKCIDIRKLSRTIEGSIQRQDVEIEY